MAYIKYDLKLFVYLFVKEELNLSAAELKLNKETNNQNDSMINHVNMTDLKMNSDLPDLEYDEDINSLVADGNLI